MTENNYPSLTRLVSIGMEINALPERCNVDKITFDYVNRGIERQNLLRQLTVDFTKDIDFSLFINQEDEVLKIYNVLYNVSGGLEGMEDKLGIGKSGQRLLVAYIFEAIKRKLWN